MDNSDQFQQRLHNQKLSSSDFKKPADVVRWLGAVQAQDFEAAKWALALRMQNATKAVIEEAYNDGKILRTHVMRPTWHFVAPEDIRWLLQLTAPRVNTKAGPYYRKFELDAATFKRSNKALTKALRGGKHLTRRELKAVLNAAGIMVDDPVRLVHVLLRAELDGVICSGPIVGKHLTYALLEERAPATKPLDRDEALAQLARRFFTSHGPASLQDFIWWSGLTAADARRGFDLVDHHVRVRQNTQKSKYAAHFLPAFDEYLVAYKDREQGELGPAVIVNGRIAGKWKRAKETIVFSPSRALTSSDRAAISSAADRYVSFAGLAVPFVY
jgi:winged helix DNA-binding protein